jgi:uncharacterized membrane protein YjdF
MKIAKRLEIIEAHIEMLTKYAPIIVAIYKHIHYDELPKDEYKTLYCEYIGIDRETFEKVAVMVLGDLHIILRKIETPTDKELQAIMSELEQDAFN